MTPEGREDALRTALAALVPLRIDEVRRSGVDPHEALARRRGEDEIVAALEAGTPLPVGRPDGDPLTFAEALVAGGAGTGRTLPALITAVALLAFTPGGCRVFGLRFDAGLPFPHRAGLARAGAGEGEARP